MIHTMHSQWCEISVPARKVKSIVRKWASLLQRRRDSLFVSQTFMCVGFYFIC